MSEQQSGDCYRFRKVLSGVNTGVQYLTKVVTHIKVPISLEGVPYKLQRLYVRFLDCKSQSVEGIFSNPGSRKWGESTRQHYRRTIKLLLESGWARPCEKGEGGEIALKSYQFVWNAMGVPRHQKKDRRAFLDRRQGSGLFFAYFKIPLESLSDDRRTYYDEIKLIIQKNLADRKRRQLRWRLNSGRKYKVDSTTFSALSTSSLFGYKSPSTGSKLRKMNFSIVDTAEKPGFNPARGRWEEPTKKIAL
jgi:hypothetical protein